MFKDVRKALGIVMPRIFSWRNSPRLMIAGLLVFFTIALNFFAAFMLSEIIGTMAGEKPKRKFFWGEDIELPLFALVLLYVGSIVLSKIFQASRRLITNPIISEAAFSLVYDIDKHLMNLSHSYFATVPTGALSEHFTTGSIGTADFTTQLLNQIIPTTTEAAAAIGLASYLYGVYPGLAFGGMFVIYSGYNSLTAKYLANNQKNLIKARVNMQRIITSMLTNYETIHLFNNLDYELNELDQRLALVKSTNTNSFSIPDKISFGQWLIIGAGFAGLILLTDGIVDIGEFIALNFYLLQFLNLFNGFGDGINKARAAIINLEQVATVFEKLPDVPDDCPNVSLVTQKNAAAVTFDKVSFGYDKKKSLTVTELSFSIPAGKKLGIVGLSGGGKSTIAKLLYRFYDVDEGSIKINNQDLRNVSLDSLRSIIAIVPQAATVFNETLKNNIWYGAVSKCGKTIDEEMLYDAIEKASLSEYVNSLPNKLETQVGERGLKISGGQLQRLALARAMLKDPDIVILDEATSALDSKTEKEIHDSLEQMLEGKTTIIISHKLYNVKDADNIIVLSEGHIVAEGTHEQLLKEDGLYAELWEKQKKEYKIKQKLEQHQSKTKRELYESLLNSTSQWPRRRLAFRIPGLCYQPVLGDGHCLFYAIALYTGQDQQTLRGFVANFFEKNLNEFDQFIDLPSGKTIHDYIEDVRNGKEWASHVEIEVLMRVLHQPIVIIDPLGKIRNPEVVERFKYKPPIFVYYNDHNHYDAFLLKKDCDSYQILQQLMQVDNSLEFPVNRRPSSKKGKEKRRSLADFGRQMLYGSSAPLSQNISINTERKHNKTYQAKGHKDNEGTRILAYSAQHSFYATSTPLTDLSRDLNRNYQSDGSNDEDPDSEGSDLSGGLNRNYQNDGSDEDLDNRNQYGTHTV
jgi:ATP-binding cassette subfamily B protein